jgi:transposase
MNGSWFDVKFLSGSEEINRDTSIKIKLLLSTDDYSYLQYLLNVTNDTLKIMEEKKIQYDPNKNTLTWNIVNGLKLYHNEKVIIYETIKLFTSGWNPKKKRKINKCGKLIFTQYDINLLFKNNVICIINGIEQNLNDLPIYNKLLSIEYPLRFRIIKLYDGFHMMLPDINDGGKIGIDPGICTFLTCTDENNNAVKIGTNVKDILKKYLTRLEKINKAPIKNCKKKRKIKSINDKIDGHMLELHNKTIKYLTYNYTHIHIGDFGKTYKNDNKIENDIDLLKYLKYDTFIEMLINKCIRLGVYVKVIDERLTTKLCHNCGYYNDTHQDNRTYKCDNCYIIVDRDVNSSINIKNRND